MLDAFPWMPINDHRLGHPEACDILRARDREGPDAWRRRWPDDPPLLDARDRVSRLLRFHCDWPNELFVPDDALGVISSNWTDDGFDPAEMVMELEDAFGIEIREDDFGKNTTYGEALRHLLLEGKPDFDKYDREALAPFALPPEYHRTGLMRRIARRFPLFGADRLRARALRRRQACRSGTWRSLWPDDPGLAAARDRVAAVLIDELGWFDGAFVPEDRLDALLLADGGGARRTGRAVEAVNRAFPNSRLEAESLAASGAPLAAFLRRLIEENP